MFDGASDQFHQFIASSRNSIPLHHHHLPFPLHASSLLPPSTFPNLTPASFDLYNSTSPPHHQLPAFPFQPNNLLHPLHHHKDEEEEKAQNRCILSMNLDTTQIIPDDHLQIDSWTNDEVLALLRIRSSMECNWFPDFTWEHVSRKLAEIGFKKSADKCKEKFEEESRYFNNNINYTSKDYRFLSELEEVYQSDQHHQNPEVVVTEQIDSNKQQVEPKAIDQLGEMDEIGLSSLEGQLDSNRKEQYAEEELEEEESESAKNIRKRKRDDDDDDYKFEIFKGFCENIVNKMMVQQEEMHNKLLEDMVKRDEENFAREEAWKKQEMDRMNKELEMMAHEQSIAGDKQSSIIEFFKKFASNSLKDPLIIKVPNSSNPVNTLTSSILYSRNPNLEAKPSCTSPTQSNPSVFLSFTDTIIAADQNPNSLPPVEAVASSNPSDHVKDDLGRRWPRDEVLALINLRCNLFNNVSNSNIVVEDKEAGAGNKAPLWERISQRMLELGYKRSAKRCKEKWENINKYFRKTKDIHKRRSLDSRTCPYFQQLSALYNQGKLVIQSERPENNPTGLPETQINASHGEAIGFTMQNVHEEGDTDQKNMN
ncbi:Trihelix transcription factor [Quillaja saponaria]|uniref:Trihelix transcription factor n=1 Tax=Quillaja saponaria TaxID=32244 RepID=A0AAD7VF93_QUISA|nr:Trihelix transcription factor [Quillaja saponaria]